MKKCILFIIHVLCISLIFVSCNQQIPFESTSDLETSNKLNDKNAVSEADTDFLKIPIEEGKIKIQKNDIEHIEIIESVGIQLTENSTNRMMVYSSSKISKIVAFFEKLTLTAPKKVDEIDFATGNSTYDIRLFYADGKCYSMVVDNNSSLFYVQDELYYDIDKEFSEFWEALSYHITVDNEMAHWECIPTSFNEGRISFPKDIELVEISRKYNVGGTGNGDDTVYIKYSKNIDSVTQWLEKLESEPFDGDMSNFVTLTMRIGFTDHTFYNFNFCLGSQGLNEISGLTSVAVEINEKWYSIDEKSGDFINDLIVWE